MVKVSKWNKKRNKSSCILLLYPTDSGNYNLKKFNVALLNLIWKLNKTFNTITVLFPSNFVLMMTNWLHLWKVWTQESSFEGDYFWNWLHVPTTKMCIVSLTICAHIFSMLFTTNWTPQYNYAHSFDSVLLLSIQDNTPTCNWTLFFPIITNSTKNCLT